MQENIMELRAAQWLARIHAAENSGLEISAWCKQNHVAKSSYYRWKCLLQQQYLPLAQATAPFVNAQLQESQIEATTTSDVTFAAIPLVPAQQEMQMQPQQPLNMNQANETYRNTSKGNQKSQAPSSLPNITVRVGEYSLEIPSDATSSQIEAVLQAVKYVR